MAVAHIGSPIFAPSSINAQKGCVTAPPPVVSQSETIAVLALATFDLNHAAMVNGSVVTGADVEVVLWLEPLKS